MSDLSNSKLGSLFGMPIPPKILGNRQCPQFFIELRNSVVKRNHEISLTSSNTNGVSPADHSFLVDQTCLRKLLEEKNREKLQDLGGVDGIAVALETNVTQGIKGDVDDIARREAAFGSNNLNISLPRKGFFYFVVEIFKDLSILILITCGALSLGFNIKKHGLKRGWFDAGSIFATVCAATAFNSISNYRKYTHFDELSQVLYNIQKVHVLRSSHRQQILVSNIVVGDVIFLNTGDQVPADGLFLDDHSLQVDESIMTGDSDLVDITKNHHPFLFSGTKVVDGYGKMLVTSVGLNSIQDQRMSSNSFASTNDQSPLQARLKKLTSSIKKLGLALASLVFVALFIRFFTGNTIDKNGNREFNGTKTKLDDIVNAVGGIADATITIVVSAIPVCLQVTANVSLSHSMKKMMKDQVLVRRLPAFENMAAVTVICTNKTGTLTSNKMIVIEFCHGLDFVEKISSITPSNLHLIREGVSLNTTGMAYKPSADFEFEFSCSPIEKAIFSWAFVDLNRDVEGFKQSCIVLQAVPFNSDRKRSGVLIKRKADSTVHVHWKGAAELILVNCSRYYDIYGSTTELSNENRERLKKIIEGIEAKGHRCIAFAHAQVSDDREHETDESLSSAKQIKEDGLTLLGIIGIKNPCLPGMKKAVQECQEAGINVILITGENVFNAKVIATDCGILRADDISSEAVVEGKEFGNMVQEERVEKIEKIRVMARSSREDKLLMVKCLKQNGHVVAVTGDSTDDAPALKEADIGISMGNHATQVARGSSDVVILDNGFSTLVMFLKWARWIYDHVINLTLVQLTANVASLAVNSIMLVSTGDVLISALGLFWANLILYIACGLELAIEKPTEKLTENPLVERNEIVNTPISNYNIWRKILTQAFYLVAVLLILEFGGKAMLFSAAVKVGGALIFNAFVLFQVYKEFHAEQKPLPISQLIPLASSSLRG